MPPNRSCSSLFSLCIKNITASILHMWKRVEVNKFHEVLKFLIKPKKSTREEFCIQMKEHLSLKLHVFIQQDLFSYVLSKVLNTKFAGVIDLSIENVDVDFIKLESACDLLEDVLFIFGREGISNLDLSHSDIMNSFGIDFLPIDIMGQICNRSIHNTLFKNAEWAKSLVSLNLQNAVDSHAVHCIGMSCQNLQFLNLLTNDLMENEVEDFVSSLSCLYGACPSAWIQTLKPTGCSDLHYLVLPVLERKMDCSEHIAKMLLFMSNLRAIRNAPMRSVIRKYISRSTKVEPLNLTEFEDEESEGFNNEHSQYAANLVENVEMSHVIWKVKSYKFSVSYESNNFNIHEIQKLKNIRRLEIDLFVFDVSWFPKFPQVTDLILKFEDEQDMGDILHISYKFSNLHHLSIIAPALYYEKINSEFDELQYDESVMLFSHLTSLQFQMLNLDNLLLIQLLIGCPKLTCLKIFGYGMHCESEDEPYHKEPFTDEDISMIVPYIANMEIIEISKIQFNSVDDYLDQLHLTKASAELLIQSCPKLKLLGCLNYWSISEEEYRNLISQIRMENFDIHLSYFQRSPWQLLYPDKTE